MNDVARLVTDQWTASPEATRPASGMMDRMAVTLDISPGQLHRASIDQAAPFLQTPQGNAAPQLGFSPPFYSPDNGLGAAPSPGYSDGSAATPLAFNMTMGAALGFGVPPMPSTPMDSGNHMLDAYGSSSAGFKGWVPLAQKRPFDESINENEQAGQVPFMLPSVHPHTPTFSETLESFGAFSADGREDGFVTNDWQVEDTSPNKGARQDALVGIGASWQNPNAVPSLPSRIPGLPQGLQDQLRIPGEEVANPYMRPVPVRVPGVPDIHLRPQSRDTDADGKRRRVGAEIATATPTERSWGSSGGDGRSSWAQQAEAGWTHVETSLDDAMLDKLLQPSSPIAAAVVTPMGHFTKPRTLPPFSPDMDVTNLIMGLPPPNTDVFNSEGGSQMASVLDAYPPDTIINVPGIGDPAISTQWLTEPVGQEAPFSADAWGQEADNADEWD